MLKIIICKNNISFAEVLPNRNQIVTFQPSFPRFCFNFNFPFVFDFSSTVQKTMQVLPIRERRKRRKVDCYASTNLGTFVCSIYYRSVRHC